MEDYKTNIVLIGMPGSGKSTIGVILAKLLVLNFMDTDMVIQEKAQRTLQDIVDTEGYMALRAVEERVLLDIDQRCHVIATGGSAAYSEAAMNHLRRQGVVVHLDATLACLRSRIHNYDTRGLAKHPDQSFEDLFRERNVLYTKYADITIDSTNLSQDLVGAAILDRLRSLSWPGLLRLTPCQP